MRILFVSANPKWTDRLELGDELRELQQGLKGQAVKLMLLPAAQRDDLKMAVDANKIDVVHFSGHAEDKVILLRDEEGFPEEMQGSELRELFKDKGIKLAVLNACETSKIADEIADVVGAAIGTTKKLDDRAARKLTRILYSRLGLGETFEQAFGEAIRATEHIQTDVYTSTGGKLGEAVFAGDILSEGETEVEGLDTYDKYFYVRYLDDQIESLENTIATNRKWAKHLVVGSGVFAIILLVLNWQHIAALLSFLPGIPDTFGLDGTATAPDAAATAADAPGGIDAQAAPESEDSEGLFKKFENFLGTWKSFSGKPLLESIMALGPFLPPIIASIKARLLLHESDELRSLRRLKALVRSAEELSPPLRKRLFGILEQSLLSAEPPADIDESGEGDQKDSAPGNGNE